MATEKSFQLYINKDNVKHYFTASGGVLNGAQISTKYVTMRTSSTTATFTMNDAGRDVLFPSAAAIAHKIDVWAQAIATLNNSKNTINVAIAGQNAITTERIHTSLNEYTGSVSGSFTKSNTSAIYVIKIANSFHAAGVRDTSITAYFTQYFCAANKAGKGVKNISVSNAAPYEGETVTFSAELYNGANFEGWYSDEACTQLVSSNLTYSTTAADLTLYAKATIDATLYNVSAVAGAEITSVNVSDSIVPEGSTATFTAQVNTGCSFEAWYSDDTYTTVVSTENPYTATITANTTLYAKAHRNSFNMSVGSAEHGTASVSATTVPYGNDATFTFTPEDETWELYGWYSDSALTQLVSEANPYTFTATEDVTLYPKTGKKRYTISFGRNSDFLHGNHFQIDIAVLYYSQLTRTEINYLRTGEYNKIDASKIILQDSISGNNMSTSILKTIKCPWDAYVAVYAPPDSMNINNDIYYSWFIKDGEVVTNWPYYWFQPIKDTVITSESRIITFWCNCSAVAKEGISYADATTPTLQEREAIFEAEVASGYTFSGWYSDESCTTLVSTNNPAYVTTPKYTTEHSSTTSLTLYAKATKIIYTIGVGTAEHGSATVSKSTAYYGDTITFNCTVDEGYEFNGWYSDEELNQLVSESNPYTHSVEGNTVLYPKVGKKIYTITLQWESNKSEDDAAMAIIDFNSLTEQEISYLKTGEYEKIDQNKVYEYIKKNGEFSLVGSNTVTLTMRCPFDMQIAMCLPVHNSSDSNAKRYGYIENYTWWPYYWYQPTENATFIGVREHNNSQDLGGCVCTAIAKEGVKSVDATSPTVGSKPAIFTATMKPGYKFLGWYSDPACISRVSTENPASVITPKGEVVNAYVQESSLTLYAKAVPLTSTTGLSFKLNGTWKNALAVFKKTNGVWVQQSDPASLFTGSPSGTESNYLYLGE